MVIGLVVFLLIRFFSINVLIRAIVTFISVFILHSRFKLFDKVEAILAYVLILFDRIWSGNGRHFNIFCFE